jgi:hypothetical protein
LDLVSEMKTARNGQADVIASASETASNQRLKKQLLFARVLARPGTSPAVRMALAPRCETTVEEGSQGPAEISLTY